MVFSSVPSPVIVGLIIKAVLCLAAIAVPCLIFASKNKDGIMKYGVGAVLYVAFVILIKLLCDLAFLTLKSPVSEALNASLFGRTMYDAITIGIFAQTGLLIGYKFIGKKCSDIRCAINVGMGFGGAYALFTLIKTIVHISYSVSYNSMTRGQFFSRHTASGIYDTMEQLAKSSLGNEVFSGLMLAIITVGYAALSVIIFMSFVKRSATIMYPTAIIMNIVLIIPMLLLEKGVPAFLCFIAEVVLCGIIIAMTIFAYKGYNAAENDDLDTAISSGDDITENEPTAVDAAENEPSSDDVAGNEASPDDEH